MRRYGPTVEGWLNHSTCFPPSPLLLSFSLSFLSSAFWARCDRSCRCLKAAASVLSSRRRSASPRIPYLIAVYLINHATSPISPLNPRPLILLCFFQVRPDARYGNSLLACICHRYTRDALRLRIRRYSRDSRTPRIISTHVIVELGSSGLREY